MAARMFSEDQLEQLRSFPDIGKDDLIRVCKNPSKKVRETGVVRLGVPARVRRRAVAASARRCCAAHSRPAVSVSRTANFSRSRSASAQSAKLAFRIGPRLGGPGALTGRLPVPGFPGRGGLG